MTLRTVIVALLIAVIPFILGVQSARAVAEQEDAIRGAMEKGGPLTHEELELDWTFYPNWIYTPLLGPSEQYLMFLFEYTNHSDFAVYLTPSYTLAVPPNIRYAANEEIAMYIEPLLEEKTGVEDETPMTFRLPAHGTRYDLITFEKPRDVTRFYVDVDVFRNETWRIQYEMDKGAWVNRTNGMVDHYRGRG